MSLLKRYQDNGSLAETKPAEFPPFTNEGVVLLEPQAVLDYRWIKQGTQLVEEGLVRWKHLPAEEATWEPLHNLWETFPNMDLEDKDPLDGGGNDRPRHSARSYKRNPKYLG